jgi:hypothetical protein
MSSGASFRWVTGWLLALLVAASSVYGQTAPGTRARSKSDRSSRATKSQAKTQDAPKDQEKDQVKEQDKDKTAAAADASKTEPAAAPEAEKPPGLFGDTKKFSRYGGWGSIGGTIGQFGMSRTALITMPPVQEELKLTTEQKDDVKKWLDDIRKHGEEMARSLRPPQSDPQASGNIPMAARIVQIAAFMNQVGDMLHENETGLAKILKPAQRKRLDQVALQMEGIAAVARPEMAYTLNIGPDQQEMIQQTLVQSRAAQMSTWIEQGRAMARLGRNRGQGGAGGGGGPAGGPGQTPGQPQGQAQTQTQTQTPGQPAPADPNKARAEQQKAMRKQFETMRDRTDQVQDQTTREILKVLTKKQRAHFDRLLGPPFDPGKVNTLGRPPGAAPGDPDPAAQPKPDGK